ncbi:MAG: TGS domain-containing protein [Prevotellaceae bacterium]|nr:TGS domain-containing protein [Prevotellaceae bacterium]
MIKFTFSDGTIIEYDKGITVPEIAQYISLQLSSEVLSTVVNGQTRDLIRPIDEDSGTHCHTPYEIF